MKLLIKKILALPTIRLSTEEFAAFIDIIDGLDKKNCRECRLLLLKKIKNKEIKIQHSAELLKYLEDWEEVASLLITWSMRLAYHFRKATGHEAGTDTMISLMIALLPKNLSLLEKMQNKMYLASLVEQSSDAIALLFTILVGAIKIKTTEKIPPKEEEQIIFVANEITKQEPIDKLAVACLEYKNYLAALIEEAIKKDKVSYIYHGQHDASHERHQLVEAVVSDIQEKKIFFGKEPSEGNAALNLLIEKYTAACDMILTCSRETQDSTHKICELLAKFSHYSTIFQQSFLKKIDNFFSPTTIEDKFLKTFQDFVTSHKIYAENDFILLNDKNSILSFL